MIYDAAELGAMRERASRPVGIGPALAADVLRLLDALEAARLCILNYSEALKTTAADRDAEHFKLIDAVFVLAAWDVWSMGWCPTTCACAIGSKDIAKQGAALLKRLGRPTT